MSYEAWRITFQSSEQAARAAFAQVGEQAARIAALEAKLKAALEQEPVAWMYDWQAPEGLIRDWATSNQAEIPKHAINIRPLYARSVPAEHPVNARLREALRGLLSHFAVPSSACRERPAYEEAVAAISAAEVHQAGPVRMTSEVVAECLKQWRSSRYETYENLAWIVEVAALRANGFKVEN